jgi:hypothetical protein
MAGVDQGVETAFGKVTGDENLSHVSGWCSRPALCL